MGAQTDLDKLGIAKNAREEKLRAREARPRQEEDSRRMAKLYRQVVLKEPEPEPLVQINPIAPAAKPAERVQEEVGAFGD